MSLLDASGDGWPCLVPGHGAMSSGCVENVIAALASQAVVYSAAQVLGSKPAGVPTLLKTSAGTVNHLV